MIEDKVEVVRGRFAVKESDEDVVSKFATSVPVTMPPRMAEKFRLPAELLTDEDEAGGADEDIGSRIKNIAKSLHADAIEFRPNL